MERELTWIEAIQKVLQDEKRALHYTEIAELIIQRQYRQNVGATPANTVNANLAANISNPTKSIFAKVGYGEYILKGLTDFISENEETQPKEEIKKELVETKLLIESMGIFWNRDLIQWKSDPDMYGVQSIGAKAANFNKQVGIYLLHDLREII
ncbi:MAG: winged helix-turn-helix domain-containing protein [Paludibacter sp.]|nr:winged helix-turn-helix domain-containing protein [Paludibacter sp.]